MKRIVLVDTMGGLGDLLLALPLVEALARSHPDARLAVVTTAPWHVLLERDERIAEVVPVHGKVAAAVVGAVRPVLERLRPDLGITTNRQHGLPQLLEQHCARAITNLWRNPPADDLVDLRMLRLLAEEGVVDPAFLDLPPRLVLGAQEVAAGAAVLASIAPDRPVLLMPDSGMAVKRWPLWRWAALAEGLLAAGRTPVVVSEAAAQRDALAAAGCALLPPRGLRELAGIAAAAAGRGGIAVGGDTGPVRLASAAGLPVVGLFGPTVASRYGYRGVGVRNLQGLPGCDVRTPTAITEQECWWTARCPLTADNAPACMADVAVGAVLAAIRAVDVHGSRTVHSGTEPSP